MKYVLAICIIAIANNVEIQSKGLQDNLERYFETDTAKAFEKEWNKLRNGFENAIQLALRESFGRNMMNVYVKRTAEYGTLAEAMFVTDGVVELLLYNLVLREIPHLKTPYVTFPLAGNALAIDVEMQDIYIKTDYLLFRNRSDVLVDGERNPDEYSPFSFQQVQRVGQMAIVGQDCNLAGMAVATMIGSSINLGLNTFKLTNCKFRIEVFKNGQETPPVIAPYFTKAQSLQLELMLSKPVSKELMPKLQGIVFSYVNTTAIFGSNLRKYRLNQQQIFKTTTKYMERAIRKLNQLSVEKSEGNVKIKDLKIYWQDLINDRPEDITVALTDMTLNGLDTGYSGHQGGPFKMHAVKLVEEIRYNNLQVRGKLRYENSTLNGEYDFSVEVQDVVIKAKKVVQAQKKQTLKYSRGPNNFEFMGWRALEYSIIDMHTYLREQIGTHNLIIGYLTNEIPTAVVHHVHELFEEAIEIIEDSVSDEEIEDKKSNDKNEDDDANGEDDDNISDNNNEHESGDNNEENDGSNKEDGGDDVKEETDIGNNETEDDADNNDKNIEHEDSDRKEEIDSGSNDHDGDASVSRTK